MHLIPKNTEVFCTGEQFSKIIGILYLNVKKLISSEVYFTLNDVDFFGPWVKVNWPIKIHELITYIESIPQFLSGVLYCTSIKGNVGILENNYSIPRRDMIFQIEAFDTTSFYLDCSDNLFEVSKIELSQHFNFQFS